MEIDKNLNIKIEQYWDIKYSDGLLINDYDRAKQVLRETLFNAVEETMRSNVPLGTFLSGGIDSTIITGIASEISNKPIDTFTIGYNDKQFDESDRAKISSKLHGTSHHVFNLDYKDVLPELDKMLSNLDEPFADSSYIPSYMVAKYARKYVKVILTGDSGDELFAGYSKYLIGYYSKLYNKIPKFIRRQIINRIVYSIPDKTSFTRKVRKVIDNADKNIFEQRLNLMCLGFKENEISKILNENYHYLNSLDIIKNYYNNNIETNEEISRALYTDFKIVLEGDMLAKVDRASMLSSLETRAPLLHKDIVELAARIPSKFKINNKNSKIILKDAFEDLIPHEVLHANKSGFGVPVGNWFRKELKEELLSLLDEVWIGEQGIFNYSYINKILDEHFTFKKNRTSELWTIYVFQRWYKEYYIDEHHS